MLPFSEDPSLSNESPDAYNEPPPDSDVAELWGEVESAQMIESNGSVGISSESSAQSNIIAPVKEITILSSSALQNMDPNEYLGMNLISHGACFSNMHDEKLDTRYPCLTLCYERFIENAASKCLQKYTKTQTSSDSTQQDNSSVIEKFLGILKFISIESPSEGGRTHTFSLDLPNTLRNMGWPLTALTYIHSTLTRAPQFGPSFLQLLFTTTSGTVLRTWMSDARKELANQLRLSRGGQNEMEKRKARRCQN